jgi:predicted dehydrogenase
VGEGQPSARAALRRHRSGIRKSLSQRSASRSTCAFYERTSSEALRSDLPSSDFMRSGAHVLVEKPIAVEVAEADRMIEAARETNRLLAVNLQHRSRPEIRTAKNLISESRLGEIQRVQMTAVWTRTRRYYELAGWRGTWRGEGGGGLMNQSPHTLDVIGHLAGQRSLVAAWNRTIFHTIETEDTSVAMLEWPHHFIGTLVVEHRPGRRSLSVSRSQVPRACVSRSQVPRACSRSPTAI